MKYHFTNPSKICGLALLMLFNLWVTPHAIGQEVAYDSINLTPKERELFKRLTLEKVNAFQEHLSIIGARESTMSTRMINVSRALKLFVNNGEEPSKCPKGNCGPVEIEISSLYRETISRPVITYLNTMAKSTKYQKVVITKAESCHVGKFYPVGLDEYGNRIYEAVATFFQKFEGYDSDGNEIYSDITKKEVLVTVTSVPTARGTKWAVQLGDISVKETKAS